MYSVSCYELGTRADSGDDSCHRKKVPVSVTGVIHDEKKRNGFEIGIEPRHGIQVLYHRAMSVLGTSSEKQPSLSIILGEKSH